MKRMSKSARVDERPVCADMFDDDGPSQRHCREQRQEQRQDQSPDRKTLQLCAQVRRAIYNALPTQEVPGSECLTIEAVEPAPDAHRLLVVVALPPDAAEIAPLIQARLARWAALLRADVARHIHRKRVPELALQLRVREEQP